jgi:L,D-transpeptidase catalytic domain
VKLGFSCLAFNRWSLIKVGALGFLLQPAVTYAETGAPISPVLLAKARAALEAHKDRILYRDVIAVVDFSVASSDQRLYIVNLLSGAITSLLVAHGRGSDPANTGRVDHFSNVMGSFASSKGSFLTGDIYYGKHGRSRKLLGLDPFNNLAEKRAIVIHAAPYVSQNMAHDQSRIGRSQGCFAVSKADLDLVLSRLGPGHLLFADKA